MARKSSIVEDLMGLAARLPWRYGVGLAVISFAMLHISSVRLAIPVTPASTTNIGALASRQLFATFARLFQVVLPMTFLAGAGVSFARQRKGLTLFNVAQTQGPAALSRMSWAEFEQLIGEAFRQRGFTVVENFQGGADGGVDLVLKRESRVFLVQCKHWRRSSVGVSVVRELNGVIAARGARGGFVITSGAFTSKARAFAGECKIELVDGDLLQAMLWGVRPDRTVAPATSATRECPKCGGGMLLRTARRGVSTGQRFWGCERFPQCRGTTPA